MTTPSEKLANALDKLHAVQVDGIVRSELLTRTYLTRLIRAGFLHPIIRGWYYVANPTAAAGRLAGAFIRVNDDAIVDRIQHSPVNPGSAHPVVEKQVLFSALQYGDRYRVAAILRDLRRLGNPALVPRIYESIPQKDGDTGAPSIHFEEIRATAPQCVNVLTALAILHTDQETLLRASSESTASDLSVLLRTAKEAEVRAEQLLRSADTEK